ETNSNFGFNLPWWDRLFGTYRAQPKAGHADMTIGLNSFRDLGTCAGLAGMLMIPFKGRVTDYVIMLFVLPLDITMSVVFMSDKEGEERRRYQRIIRTEAVLFVLMLLSWIPFLYRLLKTAF
ncbi:MAG: hypothetical protein R3174_11570, partial [Gammaproteobacteria bacterium]|nr:hypothetical protein [Gammaproteobacteria bacterium]